MPKKKLTTGLTKISINVDPLTWDIIAVRNPTPKAVTNGGQRGDIIREALRRYDEICRAHLLPLSREEWNEIINSSEHWWRTPRRRPGDLITAIVDVRRPSLDRPATGAHRKAFHARLAGLSVAETVALADQVERHWAEVFRGEEAGPATRKSS